PRRISEQGCPCPSNLRSRAIAPEPARVRRRVMASAPLSEEALKALWAQFIESRSATLRARLIECYLRLAHVAAGKFFRMRTDHAVSFSDYLQYARLGLVEAIDGFDPTREASFETYSSYRI